MASISIKKNVGNKSRRRIQGLFTLQKHFLSIQNHPPLKHCISAFSDIDWQVLPEPGGEQREEEKVYKFKIKALRGIDSLIWLYPKGTTSIIV